MIPNKIDAQYFATTTIDQDEKMANVKEQGIYTCFKLLLDIASISEYLLDNVDVRIRLEGNSDKWVIGSDTATANYKYNINMARLWIDRVTPFPSGLLAINRALAQNNGAVTYIFDKTLFKPIF